MKIKICGIRRVKDIEIVNKYLPDFIGFVFYKKSHRNISFKEAKYLSSKLDDKITPVGVFVNEKPQNIVKLFKSNTIEIAQLHGSEDEEYIKDLKELAKAETGRDLKIIKTIIFDENKDFEIELHPNSDYYLFDSGMGSGKTFNWQLIHKNLDKPFFLAGGLNEDNILYAIEEVKPFAIDISSSTETNNFKDENKIKKIIEIVKSN